MEISVNNHLDPVSCDYQINSVGVSFDVMASRNTFDHHVAVYYNTPVIKQPQMVWFN